MSSEVCCPVDEDFSASALQSYLRKFYELSINKGHNAQEIHTNVSKLKTAVFAEFSTDISRTALKDLAASNDKLIAENPEIRKNLEAFKKNLNSHAALLNLATPLPNRLTDSHTG